MRNSKIREYHITQIDLLEEKLSSIDSLTETVIIEAQIDLIRTMKDDFEEMMKNDENVFRCDAPKETKYGWYVGASKPGNDDTTFYLHEDIEVKVGAVSEDSSGYFKTKEEAQSAIDAYEL